MPYQLLHYFESKSTKNNIEISKTESLSCYDKSEVKLCQKKCNSRLIHPGLVLT